LLALLLLLLLASLLRQPLQRLALLLLVGGMLPGAPRLLLLLLVDLRVCGPAGRVVLLLLLHAHRWLVTAAVGCRFRPLAVLLGPTGALLLPLAARLLGCIWQCRHKACFVAIIVFCTLLTPCKLLPVPVTVGSSSWQGVLGQCPVLQLLHLLAALEFILCAPQLIQLLHSEPDVLARVADSKDRPAGVMQEDSSMGAVRRWVGPDGGSAWGVGHNTTNLKDCLALQRTHVNFLAFLSSCAWKALQKAHCRATKVCGIWLLLLCAKNKQRG
jgi:hypothetical protein